jgi:hypothetical protein
VGLHDISSIFGRLSYRAKEQKNRIKAKRDTKIAITQSGDLAKIILDNS